MTQSAKRAALAVTSEQAAVVMAMKSVAKKATALEGNGRQALNAMALSQYISPPK